MLERFEQTKEFDAMLVVDEQEQGSCQIRLNYNPYRTNDMEVEIFDPPDLSISGLPERPSFADFEKLDVRLLSETERTRRILEIRSDSLSMLASGFRTSLSSTMPVRRYQQEQWWRPEAEPEEVTLSYGYPLTTAVRDRSLTMKDARYGFYHGERRSGETTAQLRKDSFTVDTEVGEAEFVEAYGIHEVDSNKTHPAIALVRRSECNFNAGHLSGAPKEIVRKARETVDSLLHVISFTEQNRLNWRRERASFISEEGKPIGEIKTYRWVPPPSEGYRPNPASLRNARESFKAVCRAYADLDSTVRPVVEKAIENFKRTNCTDTLETKLVFWYSCLDHLTEDFYDCGKGPFSKRLIDACEKAEVEIADLLDPKVVRHFTEDLNDEHSCFWFVDARNRFVHEGLNALQDEPYRLIEATRNARALAERLLLSVLGIDYNNLCDEDKFCLGEPTLRQ